MSSPPLLTPLSVAELRDVAVALLGAFSFRRIMELRGGELSQPLIPRTLGDALADLRAANLPADPWKVDPIVRRLADAGHLVPAGTGRGSPPLNVAYHQMVALTQRQKLGLLWLTRALGWSFLLHEVAAHVAQVEGTSASGDAASGSGILVADGVVLTNRHVVRDMTPTCVWIGDRRFPIASVAPSATSAPDVPDIALVRLDCAPSEARAPRGLAARDADVLEPVAVMGYPPVPNAVHHTMIAQSGEVSGEVAEAYDHQPYFLVSATVRPGNSGGPIFGADGRLIGIVTRSFERPAEGSEASYPFPHFAGVPARVLRDEIALLDPALDFPWETYEQ